MRQRAHQLFEDDNSAERWLVSYADLLTLLFAFFVVMYSVSSVNEGKYRVLSDTLSEAFRVDSNQPLPIDLGGGAPAGAGAMDGGSGVTPEQAANLTVSELEEAGLTRDAVVLPEVPSAETFENTDVAASFLESRLAPLIDDDTVKIREGADWVEIELDSEFLFLSGSADLNRNAREPLTVVAETITKLGNDLPVRVEGHTDDRPISNRRYPSNWELSAARAASVVRTLNEMSIDPLTMSAVGFGEFKPISDNASVEGRKKNRRVIIAIAANEDRRDGRRVDIWSTRARRTRPFCTKEGDPITRAGGNTMTTTWVVANQKGGVGKTTSVVSLAGVAAARGKRVLVVDLDPHGSLSHYFARDVEEECTALSDLFEAASRGEERSIQPDILQTEVENIALLRTSMKLATIERTYGQSPGMGLVIDQALNQVRDQYDYILIDCPPVLGMLLVNGLFAADLVVTPVQTDPLALVGLERLDQTLEMMKKNRKNGFKRFVVPTFFDRRTRASWDTLMVMKTGWRSQLWWEVIPVDTQLREASRLGLPINLYTKGSRAALAYDRLFDDLHEITREYTQPVEIRAAS